MIKKDNNLSLALGIPGMILRLGAFPLGIFFGVDGLMFGPVSALVWLVGTGLLIGGFIFYAKSLGRNGAWGLLALLGLLGLIILACLKEKESGPPPLEGPLLSCPSCDAPYRLGDYNPDATRILCSKCKSELPLPGAS